MEKNKNIPQRMCIGCRKRNDKDKFIKIVKENNEIKIDEDQKAQGRGAYICKDKNCLNKAIKKQSLNRALKATIPKEIFEKLEELIT